MEKKVGLITGCVILLITSITPLGCGKQATRRPPQRDPAKNITMDALPPHCAVKIFVNGREVGMRKSGEESKFIEFEGDHPPADAIKVQILTPTGWEAANALVTVQGALHPINIHWQLATISLLVDNRGQDAVRIFCGQCVYPIAANAKERLLVPIGDSVASVKVMIDEREVGDLLDRSKDVHQLSLLEQARRQPGWRPATLVDVSGKHRYRYRILEYKHFQAEPLPPFPEREFQNRHVHYLPLLPEYFLERAPEEITFRGSFPVKIHQLSELTDAGE